MKRSPVDAVNQSLGAGGSGIPSKSAPVVVEIPIRTVSEANAHEHWRARQKRAKEQRGLTTMVMRSMVRAPAHTFGSLVVKLTRIAPRALDSDNAVGACKHVRDGVADWLGIDDRDPRVTWEYAQERGKPKTYAVRIEVRAT